MGATWAGNARFVVFCFFVKIITCAANYRNQHSRMKSAELTRGSYHPRNDFTCKTYNRGIPLLNSRFFFLW
ncbi:hypothetical protein PUN28_016249 [Cardiocondyla obscurior]|uniref:Secreted protein n=1 Tax=Cardiocondyla obscurior TaxID=286306 RepID=A0AAW2EWV3_9HYME